MELQEGKLQEEELQEGDRVDLVIQEQTNLGYIVLINDKHEGLLYNNEVFSDIEEGMQVEGFIKKIREDNKIDVALRPQGFRNVIDNDVDIILEKLEEKGFIMLTDKSSPEAIRFRLQMSKKAFKKAIGNLYRQKLINLKEDRIELIGD